jgi:dihydropteroate synthase
MKSLPALMGILNVNPASFCPTGRQPLADDALRHAEQMVHAGAQIIDIGGEPTNPQISNKITVQQELDSVIPVVEQLRQRFAIDISVDTSQPQVMQAAVQAGATMINDVRALRVPGALAMAVKLQVPVCLMHMQYPNGVPEKLIEVGDMLSEVKRFLQARRQACIDAGMLAENIVLDPGFGGGSFGKTTQQNISLIQHFSALRTLGSKLLVGVSRKTFIGEILDADVEQRIVGSVVCGLLLAQRGADILRVHDVKATADALRLLEVLTA